MIEHARYYTIPAALSLLPAPMRGDEATALLLAIGLQESRFLLRRQLGGPARGFWQFETNGVRAVLNHERTVAPITLALEQLRYDARSDAAFVLFALEDNDVLAAVFARCLLWTLPDPLPGPLDTVAAWDQYIAAWRPGQPRRASWDTFYAQAWALTRQRKEDV